MKEKIGLTTPFLALILLLTGCCHPPVSEISLTQALLERDQERGITSYAPEKFGEAQNLLKKAQTLSTRECEEAWKALKLAQMKVREAEEEARKARFQARRRAQKAILEARKALKEALGAQAPQYAPDIYEAAQALLGEAREAFQKGDYLESESRAQKAATLAEKAREASQKVKEILSGDTSQGPPSPRG